MTSVRTLLQLSLAVILFLAQPSQALAKTQVLAPLELDDRHSSQANQIHSAHHAINGTPSSHHMELTRRTFLKQHGNNFTIVDATDNVLAFVAFPERDFGDLTVSDAESFVEDKQDPPVYETPHEIVQAVGFYSQKEKTSNDHGVNRSGAMRSHDKRVCDARCKRAKWFVRNLFIHADSRHNTRQPKSPAKDLNQVQVHAPDAIRGIFDNVFSPTECRKEFNKRVVQKALEGDNVVAVLSVTDLECGHTQLYGDHFQRFNTGITCGVLIFTYSVVTVEGDNQASFIYFGRRGWNMWGNAGWTSCLPSGISKVVNFECHGERPTTQTNACA